MATNFLVVYDQDMGIIKFCGGITPERFSLKDTGVRSVKCRVEDCIYGETNEQAAKRLTDAGFVLASTGDLAGYLHDHPEEVEKWYWSFAISDDSSWACPDGRVGVPRAFVYGRRRDLYTIYFCGLAGACAGVLVVSE